MIGVALFVAAVSGDVRHVKLPAGYASCSPMCGLYSYYRQQLGQCECVGTDQPPPEPDGSPGRGWTKRGVHPDIHAICPGQSTAWLDGHASEKVVTVSGNCSRQSGGEVLFADTVPVITAHALTIQGVSPDARVTIRGPCPLLDIGSRSPLDHNSAPAIIIKDIQFHCTSGSPAIRIGSLAPKTSLTFSNLDFYNTAVGIRAVRISSRGPDPMIDTLPLGSMQITHSTIENRGPHFLAIFGHTVHTEGVTVDCTDIDPQIVLIQPFRKTDNHDIGVSGGCTLIDVSAYTRMFGKHYETQFYNKNAYLDGFKSELTAIILYETYAVVALMVGLLYGHQQFFYLRRLKKK